MTLKWKPWTGKPSRPVELNGKDHNCSDGDTSGNKKWIVHLKPSDYVFCDMCGKTFIGVEAYNNNKSLNYIPMENHIKTFHPNGEILDEIDDAVKNDKEKENMRIELNQPKRTVKYTRKGKTIL